MVFGRSRKVIDFMIPYSVIMKNVRDQDHAWGSGNEVSERV